MSSKKPHDGRTLESFGISRATAERLFEKRIAEGSFEWDPWSSNVPQKLAKVLGDESRAASVVAAPQGDGARVWYHVERTNRAITDTASVVEGQRGFGFRYELVASKRGAYGVVSQARLCDIDDDGLAVVTGETTP